MGPGAETHNKARRSQIYNSIKHYVVSGPETAMYRQFEGLHQQIKQSIVNLYILGSELDSSIERVDRKFDRGAFLFLFNFSPWLPK